MFGMIDGAKVAGGAAIGFLACYIVASLWWIPSAEKTAREGEASRLNAATDAAIGELTNEADRARVNRRRCLELGKLYSFESGKCIERPAPGDG